MSGRWRRFVFTLLLSACTAPNQPTRRPATCKLPNLQTSKLAHLHQAAYNYARYHALALRQAQDRPPTTSWAVRLSSRQSLKRLAEVCTALEDPSTGLRAGAGVGRARGHATLWLSEAETVAKFDTGGKEQTAGDDGVARTARAGGIGRR